MSERFELRCRPMLRTRRSLPSVLALMIAAGCGRSDPAAPAAAATTPAAPRTAYIAYRDARPVLEAFHGSLPADLAGKSPQQIEDAWPAWTARHDAAIRARLAQGDEDSVVNFWLYGTSFTRRPRATAQQLARMRRPDIEDLLVGRLDDM